jgi:RNA polymerase sigma factor (TIGR02999 family)
MELESKKLATASRDTLLSRTLYSNLRGQAAAYLDAEGPGCALEPTELVHEAWVRLVSAERLQFADETHFRAVAAMTMRRVLIDGARCRRREKRGGGALCITLSEAVAPASTLRVLDASALDEALTRLAALDAREARVVELRFFAGLDEVEIARVLRVSRRTVQSEWAHARAWLQRELMRDDSK